MSSAKMTAISSRLQCVRTLRPNDDILWTTLSIKYIVQLLSHQTGDKQVFEPMLFFLIGTLWTNTLEIWFYK